MACLQTKMRPESKNPPTPTKRIFLRARPRLIELTRNPKQHKQHNSTKHMNKKLNIIDVLSNGTKIGITNFIPLVLSVLLWAITCWIPYLNIGTTIAICSLPLELSRGKIISPLSIFDGKYRQKMGEFFLVVALMNIAIVTGSIFFIAPGIVLTFSYMFATLLVLDKGMNSAEALSKSNEMTYGNKLMIFLSFLALFIAFIIISSILSYIWSGFVLILALLLAPIMLAMQGYIYAQLSQDY